MKANRFALRARNDDRAEVGIGTLIVFIAAILVAAVAAAVLITTSGQLQEQGSQTAGEATQQVGTSLKLVSIYASRPAATGNMEHLNLTISVGPGSPPVDLSNTTISIASGDTRKDLVYVNGNATNLKFNASEVRDADNSFTVAIPTMTSGDLVTIWIDLSSGINNVPLAPGAKMDIRVLPPLGAALVADITMPASFGTDKVVEVR